MSDGSFHAVTTDQPQPMVANRLIDRDSEVAVAAREEWLSGRVPKAIANLVEGPVEIGAVEVHQQCLQSATINRTGRISRTGLAEHRDALMSIARRLSQRCGPFIERDRELRARRMSVIQPASPWPATPAA